MLRLFRPIGRKAGHKKRALVQIFNETASKKKILDCSK